MAVNHVDTSIEALVLSVSQRGSVDFDYMSSLTDKDKPTLIEELKGEIFLNIRKKENSKGLISFNIENEDLPLHLLEKLILISIIMLQRMNILVEILEKRLL